MRSKLIEIQDKYDLPPGVVRLVLKELIELIVGDMDVPKPFNIFRWSKFGKKCYKQFEELREWF